jgi:outer membrane protein TolC
VAAGYRSGRFSSLELLEGQRSLLEAELQLIDATAEVWRARAALERLLGRSIESLGEEGQR